MSWLLASSLIVGLILFAGWFAYERTAALGAHGRGRGHTRGRRRARSRRVRRAPRRQADHCDRVRRRLLAWAAAGLHRRRDRDARLEHHARSGPVYPLADGRLGPRRPRRRRARSAHPPTPRSRPARTGVRAGRADGQGDHEPLHIHPRRGAHSRGIPRDRRHVAAVRHHRHHRHAAVRACLRSRARSPARAHARAHDR